MIWGIFICCTIVTSAAIPLLFLSQYTVLQGIAMSIVAAYIFYIIMQFIPALIENYKKRSFMAIAYRKLQIMLNRLDALFIDPYKKVNGMRLSEKIDLTLERFFEKEFLSSFLEGFDLSQESNCQNPYTKKAKSYSDYLEEMWEACQKYGNEALNTLYMQYEPDLAYQIQFLLYDNTINCYFHIVKLIPSMDYQCVLALNQKDYYLCTQSIQNIIVLHKYVFDMYEKLRKDKRFSNIYEPGFYRGKGKNKK